MRRDSQVADALAEYVDALVHRVPLPAPPDAAFELVARRLHSELRARDPDPRFVDHLRLRLIAAADQRSGGVIVSLPAWRQPRFIIGAAGIVSAAALIALVARSRTQSRVAA